MTPAADDTADEAAFEAFLAGRPVSEEAADSFPAVAAFADAVRATATLPGRPNAALADLLSTGLLTDQSSPSIRTAPSAGKAPRRSRVRRRRRFAMFFPALLAKFLSAGAVAQACSGAGIALVAFTGAGAAGVLPGPVQDTFSSVVGTETADETSAPDDTTGNGVDEVTDVTGTDDGTETVDGAPEAPVDAELTLEDWEQGPGPDQSFGEWVSSGARKGYADGATISCWAHHRNDERKGREVTECAPAASAEGTETVDAPEVETPEAETSGDSADTEQSTDGDRGGNRGQGNGGGNGHGGGGNSGRGHN